MSINLHTLTEAEFLQCLKKLLMQLEGGHNETLPY